MEMQKACLQLMGSCLGYLKSLRPQIHLYSHCVYVEVLHIAGACGLTAAWGCPCIFWMPQGFWTVTPRPAVGAAWPDPSVWLVEQV